MTARMVSDTIAAPTTNGTLPILVLMLGLAVPLGAQAQTATPQLNYQGRVAVGTPAVWNANRDRSEWH